MTAENHDNQENYNSEPIYRPFVARTLSHVPDDFHAPILYEYADRSPDGTNPKANTWLRESIQPAFASDGLPLTANAEDISRYTEKNPA